MLMKDIQLNDLLNSNKILFHYGKYIEGIAKGKSDYNPISIEIHPTAKCNHRCIHCSYKERNECRVSLDKEVMEKLIDSIINMGIKAVYFSGGGEPTLYPKLKDYIVKLHDAGVETAIITNGSYFEKAGLIDIAYMLNYIAISVPAIDPVTFKKITGSELLENVLSLPAKIKAVHKDKSPILGARIVLTNLNYMYVPDFMTVLKDREYDYALFKVIRDYEDNGQGLSDTAVSDLKSIISETKNVDNRFTNINSIFDYRKKPEFKNKCWANQFGMIANVSMDGKVYPNIVEIDKPEFCIGDLNKNTLEEIWNSERHIAVKEKSNEKWLRGECVNCRCIAYNKIINEINDRLPHEYDPFI